jgi:hypothetical protein
MPEFLIRLLIVVLVIWLVQVVLGLFTLKDPIPKVILGVTVVVGLIFLLFGFAVLPLSR